MLGIGGGGDQMAERPLTDSSDYKLQDKYSTFAANPLHLISYIIVPRVLSILLQGTIHSILIHIVTAGSLVGPITQGRFDSACVKIVLSILV